MKPPKYLWPAAAYVHTRQSRRMWELITTVRESQCLGLVCGRPGVGKTVTAHRYADWKKWEKDYRGVLPSTWVSREGVAYLAAHSASTPWTFIRDLLGLVGKEPRPEARWARVSNLWRDLEAEDVNTLLLDEADRLNDECLEVARDLYDRTGISVVLLGTPKLERRVEKFPQLYSRIGFYLEYEPFSVQETEDFLALALSEWEGLVDGPRIRTATRTFTAAERAAIRGIHRTTGGVVREIRRLMEQVERIVRVNGVPGMDIDVVRLAAECLFRERRRRPPEGAKPPAATSAK